MGNAGVSFCSIWLPVFLLNCSISFLMIISANWSPTDSSLSSELKACFLKTSKISFLFIVMFGFVMLFRAEDITLCPSSMKMLTRVV